MNHKGNMNMKLSFSVVALLMSSTFASANSLTDYIKAFPAHVQDGYRDTGCDPDQQVQVDGTNYFNNPTCPVVKGPSDSDKAAVKAPKSDDSDDGNDDSDDDNGGPTSDDHGPSDDGNGDVSDNTSDNNDDGPSNDNNNSDDSNGDNSDGDNGHGNDDDHYDDSNPGKGKGKGRN